MGEGVFLMGGGLWKERGYYSNFVELEKIVEMKFIYMIGVNEF